MPSYKLTYFDGRARAEISRLLFAAAGQEFEDCRLSQEEWGKLKATAHFAQLPYLSIKSDGNEMFFNQSMAIARFLARKFDLACKSDDEKFLVDMYTEESQDLFSHFPSILFAKDPETKASLLKKLSEEAFPNKMNYFQGVLAKNNTGFLVGSDLTVADLNLFSVLTEMKFIGVDVSGILDSYPSVKAHEEKIKNLPKIAEWIKNRPTNPMGW